MREHFTIFAAAISNFWSCRQIAGKRAGPAASKQHPQTKKLENSLPLKLKTQFVIKSIGKDRVDSISFLLSDFCLVANSRHCFSQFMSDNVFFDS